MSVKVSVKNFQSLKDTQIVVDGMTTIMGPNNTGKSALMRAIRAVFTNPGGSDFIHHGEDQCSVTLEFDDGNKVTWIKSRKRNVKPKYIINGETIYPGRGVPEELAQAANISPIKLGDDSYWPNFAPQITGQVFLMDKPGSLLAEAVSDIKKVRKLNGALKASESERKKTEATLKVRREDLNSLQETFGLFEGLDPLLDAAKLLEERREALLRMQAAATLSATLCQRHFEAKENVDLLQGVVSLRVPAADLSVGEIERVIRWERRLTPLRFEVTQLQGVDDFRVPSFPFSKMEALEKVVSLEKTFSSATEAFASLSSIADVSLPCPKATEKALVDLQELSDLEGRLRPLSNTVEALQAYREPSLGFPEGEEKRVRALEKVLDFEKRKKKAEGEVEELLSSIQERQSELKRAQEELTQLMSELGQCPTCGADFKEGHDHVSV